MSVFEMITQVSKSDCCAMLTAHCSPADGVYPKISDCCIHLYPKFQKCLSCVYPNTQMYLCRCHATSLFCDSIPKHKEVNILEAALRCLCTPNTVVCSLWGWPRFSLSLSLVSFLHTCSMDHVCIPSFKTVYHVLSWMRTICTTGALQPK